ncbi:DNA polymerase III subunit delta [bacterium]|nr:DNA polymerase III subunit delta [bacterium]
MIYFYYGDEEFNISEKIKVLKSKLDKNFLEMSYKEFDNPKFSDLMVALSTQPMMFGRMLIVIDCESYFKSKKKDSDAEGGFDDSQIKQIEKALENANENLDIVFRAYTPYDPKKKNAVDKRKKIFKVLSKYNSQEFNQIPSYKTAELEAWIKNRAKLHDLKINSDAVSLLLLQVGSNLRMLDSELEKLKVFTKDKPATKEMVKEICVSNEDLFAFMDSVVIGAKAKALEQYEKLVSTRYPLSILATLHSNLRDKIFLKANGTKYSQDEIAKMTGMHPYRVKLELQKLKQVSLKDLVKLKENLTEAEYKIKSGQSNIAQEREIEYAILR